MSQTESEILNALTDLERTVAAMSTSNPKPSLQPVFERIDRLAAQLPPDADPDLRHYLNRKSYTKAIERLKEKG